MLFRQFDRLQLRLHWHTTLYVRMPWCDSGSPTGHIHVYLINAWCGRVNQEGGLLSLSLSYYYTSCRSIQTNSCLVIDLRLMRDNSNLMSNYLYGGLSSLASYTLVSMPGKPLLHGSLIHVARAAGHDYCHVASSCRVYLMLGMCHFVSPLDIDDSYKYIKIWLTR